MREIAAYLACAGALLIGSLLAAPAPAARAAGASALDSAPADVRRFVGEVRRRLAARPAARWTFLSWEAANKPTEEGFGILAAPVDAEAVIRRVMDVDNYRSHIPHVAVSRSIADARFPPPASVRAYQLLELPVIKNVHYEIALIDAGRVDGYRLVYWYLLEPETARLSGAEAARSQHNMGAWISDGSVVGYALSAAPRREDVDAVSWQLLTTGADVVAESVIKDAIQDMVRWAAQ